MAADHLKSGPDIFTSLDRFGMNKIFFITTKLSRLVSTIPNPDEFESRMRVESETRMRVESETQTRFGFWMSTVYSIPPNTGLSGIRIVAFRTQFVSYF
jgi:hypothetical protein